MDNITLDEDIFFRDPDLIADPDGNGPLTGSNGPEPLQCDPALAGQYLCNELGKRLTSSIGYSVVYNNTNGIRPTRGQAIVLSQDFAGLGGDVRYIRSRLTGTKYWGFGGGFVFSARAEGGYIHALEQSPGPYEDAIRITDRFFGTQLRGFDIRGIGPRILRENYNADGTISEDDLVSDALGGRAYYMGRLELELPTSSSLRSFGLRPSAFVDVGSVWGLKSPELVDVAKVCQATGLENKQIPGGSTNLSCTQFNTGGVTAYSDVNSVPGVPRALCRQFAETPSLHWYRRQLGFAFRAAQDRPREGDPQAGRRRHQTLQLQRRNTILMRKNILLAAIAASMIAVPTAVSAQRLPATVVAVVDTGKIYSDCTACAAARTQLQSQATALQTRQKTLTDQLRPRAAARDCG